MNVSANLTLVTFTKATFGVFDYIVFAAFLCVSGGVGIFFSCRGQKTTHEYFLGNRQMKPIPVGISAGVSFVSSSVLVGVPAEVYINGYHYVFGLPFAVLGFFSGNMLIAYIVHPLKMTNLNQYFFRRFGSRPLMALTNVLVLGCIFHYMGFCMLGSVIAFSSITNGAVSIPLAIIIGGVVGIFYTSIGGLKAVVWTDVIQSTIMFTGIIVVLVSSVIDTSGGLQTILEQNQKFGRFHVLDWSPDITIRHTMWGMIFGCFCNWLVWSSQPASVQRLCSTPRRKDGFIVASVTGVVFLIFTMLPVWAGINIFGYYANLGCDVFAAGWIKDNEIILYYIRERLNFVGFQGLFIAALYSGSLSSLSSGLNAVSAIAWKDIIQPTFKVRISENKATLVCKLIVVGFGILSMLWCYALHRFGGLILQVCASIDASVYGVYFGLFFLAVFFRPVNAIGAFIAIITSFTLTLWLGLGSLIYGRGKSPRLESPFETCDSNHTMYLRNVTSEVPSESVGPVLDYMYSISYIWLSPFCLITLTILALLISLCTKRWQQKDVDPKLIFPLCRRGTSHNEKTSYEDGNEALRFSDPQEMVNLRKEEL